MRKIILYGAGRNGVRYAKWLSFCGLGNYIYAFCDKNAERIKTVCGIGVYKYSDLKEESNADWLLTPDDKEAIEIACEQDGLRYFSSFSDYIDSEHAKNVLARELISEQPISVDEFDAELRRVYRTKDNYKIVNPRYYGKSGKICYIFFSGNGLYRVNTIGELRRTIYAEDRFEWEYIANLSGVTNTCKCIFIRDIYKNFYVNGISEKFDDIEKLVDFLREETDGYSVYTVGNSAGGYMAMLAGSILRAERVYSFSGIVDLYEYNNAVHGDTYYFMKKYRDNFRRNRYFNISNKLSGNMQILFFYATKNEEDIRQANKVRDNKNVVLFPIDSDEHGKMICVDVISNLFTYDEAELLDFCEKNRDIVKRPCDY